MGKVNEIYKQNIYGVITTLIFHIIVLIVLLTSNLKHGKQSAEEAVLLDFTVEEIKLPEPVKEKELQAETTPKALQMQGSLASNRAVNDASKDPFFDKSYNKEIEDAKQLASDVNKTLAKKIPKIADIRMPEDNAEGKPGKRSNNQILKGNRIFTIF